MLVIGLTVKRNFHKIPNYSSCFCRDYNSPRKTDGFSASQNCSSCHIMAVDKIANTIFRRFFQILISHSTSVLLPSRSSSSFPEFGVFCDETRFWVIHRRDCYGPFDYQWSGDLYGVELLYQGDKYGECCNSEQFFADLKPYQLPRKVSEV